MQRITSNRRQPSGFGLVETVVGAAIIIIVLFVLVEVGRATFRIVDESSYKIQSAFLAEEGIEAVRTLRDTSWASQIAPLALDANLYLSFLSGAWSLSNVPTAPIDGRFTRVVRISAVCRDATDAISACGGPLVIDVNTRSISVLVGWQNRGSTATTTLSTYLTNIFAN